MLQDVKYDNTVDLTGTGEIDLSLTLKIIEK